VCALVIAGALAVPGCFSSSPTGAPSEDASTTDDSSVPFDATSPIDTGSEAATADVADASNPVDATPDAAPGCNLAMPFGPRSLVPGLATQGSDEYAARLTADQLTAYFQSNRYFDGGVSGFFEIYTATRPTLSAPFGNATILLNWVAPDVEKPTITADGLTLYANRQDLDDAGFTYPHIYASTRASTGVDFPAPGVVSSIFLPGGFERDPFITADGSTLYFMDFYNLYTAANSASGFAAPQIIAAASSAGDVQGGPVPSADGLTLYFFSSRSLVPDGGPGADNNVWMSRRVTTSDAFGAPVNVAELNTPANDEPVWLSPDGCTLWFASTLLASEDAGISDTNTHVFQATRGR
jgi:WD40-like Beta Propeller Repeat